MKKISIVVPCYNEKENVIPMGKEICSVLEEKLNKYDYEIIFIDNCSTDGTRELLRQMCAENIRIKAIFNVRNFGQFNSPYYALMQSTGDCSILMCCDFQDPVELIPSMVEAWEKGSKIVAMQKTKSEENKLVYFLRSCFYKVLSKFSGISVIEHFTGFGLYDRKFIDLLKELNDPIPFLRGIVAELGFGIKVIPYKQNKRKAGKTHNNIISLYDAIMLSFTSYTKFGLRGATFLGFGIAIMSVIIAIIYFVLKLLYWDRFNAGMAPIVLGMFFLGAVQLVFLGIIGEYIININIRIKNRPLVVEEERIGFDEKA